MRELRRQQRRAEFDAGTEQFVDVAILPVAQFVLGHRGGEILGEAISGMRRIEHQRQLGHARTTDQYRIMHSASMYLFHCIDFGALNCAPWDCVTSNMTRTPASPATPDENLPAYYARRANEYERIYAKPERQADLAQLRFDVPALLKDELVLGLPAARATGRR